LPVDGLSHSALLSVFRGHSNELLTKMSTHFSGAVVGAGRSGG